MGVVVNEIEPLQPIPDQALADSLAEVQQQEQQNILQVPTLFVKNLCHKCKIRKEEGGLCGEIRISKISVCYWKLVEKLIS